MIGADQVDLDLVAEDHAEDERREREAELHHRVAEQPEGKQHVDVRHGVVERIGADHAQHQHHRKQRGLRTLTMRRNQRTPMNMIAIMMKCARM